MTHASLYIVFVLLAALAVALLVIIRLLDHRDARHDAQRGDLGTAWQHRRFLDRGHVAEHPNRWRMG